MPKQFEDIVSPERKKTIRDIPIPENRRKNIINSLPTTGRPSATPLVDTPTPVAPSSPSQPKTYQDFVNLKRNGTPIRRKEGLGGKTIIFGALGVLVLAFAVLSLFGGGKLSYTPKSLPITFSDTAFSAGKTATSSGLVYTITKLSGSKGEVVPATGEETVERKARGTIIVYNNDSTTPKRLLIDTRFETPEGLIYMVPKVITIPGKKTVNGVVVPGTLEVEAVAEKAGEAYNIELTDFKLPGFKGTPRYDTVYARSKTPMTGGFVGTVKEVKEEDLARAKESLENALEAELISQARSQVGNEYVLFPSLSALTFEELPQSGATADSVTINVGGYLIGVMFDKQDLAKHLSSLTEGVEEGDEVEFLSPEELQISYVGEPPLNLLTAERLNLSVSGTNTLVWNTDENTLKMEIAGKSKTEIESLVENYPGVASIKLTISPFWKSTFPEDPQSITIEKLPI